MNTRHLWNTFLNGLSLGLFGTKPTSVLDENERILASTEDYLEKLVGQRRALFDSHGQMESRYSNNPAIDALMEVTGELTVLLSAKIGLLTFELNTQRTLVLFQRAQADGFEFSEDLATRADAAFELAEKQIAEWK
jgi:hypothetical protein